MDEADDKTHRVEDKSMMSTDTEESRQAKCEELGNMNRAAVIPDEKKVHVTENQTESGKEFKEQSGEENLVVSWKKWGTAN
jgi:hypothetical protein